MNTGMKLSASCRKAVSRCLAAVLLLVCVLGTAAALADGNWICPNCGRENVAEANFCGGCRTAKPQEAADVRNADINAWMCSSCGKIVSSGDSFCINCGMDHLASDTPAILVPAVVPEETAFGPATVERIAWRAEDGKLSYRLTIENSGTHYLWIADQKAEMQFLMTVKDEQGNKIAENDFYLNKASITLNSSKGKKYNVEVRCDTNSGSYTLCIGRAKPVQEVQEYGIIRDSMSFERQKNRYKIVPTITGLHSVEILESQKGFTIKGCIKDSDNYTVVASDFGMEKGWTIRAKLKAGETYYIEFTQCEALGDYALMIGRPKKTVNISGCGAFGDSHYYVKQANVYEYTAQRTGTHRFVLSQIAQGNEVDLEINDAWGYTVARFDRMHREWYREAELTAGETYKIVVRQYEGLGSYSYFIETP